MHLRSRVYCAPIGAHASELFFSRAAVCKTTGASVYLLVGFELLESMDGECSNSHSEIPLNDEVTLLHLTPQDLDLNVPWNSLFPRPCFHLCCTFV